MHRLITGTIPNAAALNAPILAQLEASSEHWAHSHWVGGRWENTYVSFAHMPALRELMEQLVVALEDAWGQGLRYLHDASDLEQSSFWFNIAPPGASTGVHRHSERASVSMVYYLQADEEAGALYFQDSDDEVTPEAGKWASFPPSAAHAVRENRSARDRISLAINAYAT